MVTQAIQQDSYIDSLRAIHQRLNDAAVPWLGSLRESAMDRFRLLGFPTTRHEEWKYTNVAPIAKSGFLPVEADAQAIEEVPYEGASLFAYPEVGRSQVVFVNGRFRASLSNLEEVPSEVKVIPLSEAVRDNELGKIVREHLARGADYNESAFTALNTAFIREGVLIYLPRGSRLTSPVQLLFMASAGGAGEICFPRVLVVAEPGSAGSLVESYVSDGAERYWTNAVTEVVLKADSKIEHVRLQRESQNAFHTAVTHASLGRNSSYNTTSITFGAQLSRHDIHVSLDDERAECWVDGLYMVGGAQHADTHSVIDHRVPHCTSHQLYKGILDGKSRAVFNGKVFVRPGARGTDAIQTNRNLLLSTDAHVDTKPQLEIYNDDVKCAHGATVGQLEEEELFYLLSRGLRPDLARNLLTYGFAEEVINKINVASIKNELDEAVLNRLNVRLET